ncbi:TonB-dependent receptor [Gilvimarinus polysaccharolyticus]|uniref:TonB-dependent receptor n=1 Tax=Gilvimarinus polysaccharolyticus TaxID=863921 RepID=UPI000A41596E|nr:TonB-dependent receptor [Gilvimarinus polysaccharolyticus]
MTIRTRRPGMKSGIVTLASSLLVLTSVVASAQDDANDDMEMLEEIVVQGARLNLQNAQDIKRDADTFVDAISAEDIGSLPDRSVLEAMQRLPGVSIERFAGPDDPDHFSVEGSGAVIRGMSATRSEFNGRDSFTANSGRGLSFQDVSPELMGGVDIYKNQTADMIEGGIGGTVSLRTRKPFDSDGRVLSLGGDISYGDMAEKSSPTISGLYSDRWNTEVGEFGFLANFAYSKLYGESHAIQSDAYVIYDASVLPGAENFVGDGTGTVWMPNGSNLLMKEDDRERQGYAAALQWASPDETMEATVQFMRSDATLAWTETALKYQGGYYDPGAGQDKRFTRPVDGTEFSFDDEGLFESGFMGDTDGWRAADDNAERIPRAWNDGVGADEGIALFGHKYQSERRFKETNTVVDDFAVNFKWTPTDQFELEADLQYVQAETVDNDLVVMLGVNALQDYDTTSSTPTLGLVEPWNGVRDADRANGGGIYDTGYPGFSGDDAGDSNYFQDPNSYWWRSAMDHYERSDGDSIAGRLDGTYHFDGDAGLLRAVKVGVRYAERQQTVRNTDWNWGSVGPEFSGGNPALFLPDVESQASDYEVVDWSDFHGGGVVDISGGGLIHPTEEFVQDLLYQRREIVKSGAGDWVPYPNRTDVVLDDEFGLFSPGQIFDTTETNQAAYVRLDFGSDEHALRFSGNVGLRYVKIERESLGSVAFPDLVPEDVAPSDIQLPLTSASVEAYLQGQVDAGTYGSLKEAGDADENDWAGDRLNYLSDDERNFGNNAENLLTAVSDYDAFLPSFNLKLELTDDLIMRFAAAKAIAMPDMGDVKNQADLGTLSIEVDQPQVDPNNPPPVNEYSGIRGAYVSAWTGSGGNPYLQPMESTQYDLSLEWYFASVGSLTATVFHKDLNNFFIHGAFPQTYTNPTTGVTNTADVTGTRNGGEGTMDGVELAYQQFFDMLPEPFDGLGVQANYTYIDASGVPNNEESYEDAGWIGGDEENTSARVSLDSVPFQGQSEHTANLVLMYEKNDWSARVAYNWRSKYLLTTRDVISKYPLWSDDAGYMDASVYYNVNDNVQVGLQFTNLLDTQTETLMILDDGGTEAGRSWFKQDRRASFVVRANF